MIEQPGPLYPPRPPGVQPIGPTQGKRCPMIDRRLNGDQRWEARRIQIQEGCRWIDGGYDVCANGDWYRYPQCVAGGSPQPTQNQATPRGPAGAGSTAPPDRLPWEQPAYAAPPKQAKGGAQPDRRVKGKLSDSAEVAVSMEDFIQFMSGPNRPGLAAPFNGQYGVVRDAKGKVIRDFRYVRTPFHPDAIIDMRHFQFVGPLSQDAGSAIEQVQGAMGQGSAYNRQDYYSNALGEYFTSFNWNNSGRSYADNLRSFFGPSSQTLINSLIESANKL
jgi:hypothetical protein